MKIPLIALLSLCFLPLSSFAKDRAVTVSGTCTRDIATDRGSVVVTATAKENNIKDAVSKATRSYERALDSIKRLKLENSDIKTVEYSVGEAREWEKDKSVFKGYQARIGIKISTSDVQRLGEVTAIAAREGIQDVGSLTSYLSEDKLLKEQTLCLKDAAEHAREKAERLATTLDARLGEVIEISEGNVSTPAPRPLMAMHAAMRADVEAAPAPTIQAGDQQVSATVEVTFALK